MTVEPLSNTSSQHAHLYLRPPRKNMAPTHPFGFSGTHRVSAHQGSATQAPSGNFSSVLSPEEALLRALQACPPSWPNTARRVRLFREESSEADWDGQGTLPVQAVTWQDALLGAIRAAVATEGEETWPEPSISPCGDGSVHVSWWFKEPNLEARFETRDGRFVWSVYQGNDERASGEASLQALRDELRGALG